MIELRLNQFGKDHWSTLLYIESCIVDGNGTIKNDKMRCDFDRHPQFVGRVQAIAHADGRQYPTTLADGSTLPNHDDWDCVDDLMRAGAVVWGGTGLNPVFRLTDIGWNLAGRLRRYLGESRAQGVRGYSGFAAECEAIK